MGSRGIDTATLAIAAGGTGGHLFPGLSVARAWLLRHPGGSVVFFGTKKDARYVEGQDPRLRFVAVSMQGVAGRGVRGIAGLFVKGVPSILAMIRELLKGRPCAAVCFGGFVSFPVGVAAWVLRIPLFIHEANAIPGMVNRLLRRWAKKMFVAHAGMLASWGTHALLVGIPVRDGIEDAKSFKEDFKKSGLNSRPVRILVIGGSQGAYSMNRIVLESLEQLFLRLDAEVILQWGKWPTGGVESYLERFKGRLLVLPFIEDMALTYRWADVIVSRSGASTLAELAFVEKPTILVPFPFATHNHQLLNAQAAERAGAAVVLEEKHLNADNFVEALVALAQDPACWEHMGLAWKSLAHPKAADRMIETIEAYMKGVHLNVPAKPYAVFSGDRRNRDERDCRASVEP